MARDEPFDLARIRTYALADRESRVRVESFGKALDGAPTLDGFLRSLPDCLGARALLGLARDIAAATAASRPVVWACGGHVVKVGLAPIFRRMMERGRIAALAINGATAIHDFEIAATGATSEDVAEALPGGRFGMARETGEALNGAAAEAAAEGRGLGETLAGRIAGSGLPHRGDSLLAAAFDCDVPVTVHVAVGSDIVHMHPGADGAAIGAATHVDFRKLISRVADLGGGGVWINCGSAVQLPEVFLKAVSAAINAGADLSGMITADLDMQRHYRTTENVLRRPIGPGGRSHALTGHHEINVPLLAAAVEWTAGQPVRPG